MVRPDGVPLTCSTKRNTRSASRLQRVRRGKSRSQEASVRWTTSIYCRVISNSCRVVSIYCRVIKIAGIKLTVLKPDIPRIQANPSL
jgi:hypothetical protein